MHGLQSHLHCIIISFKNNVAVKHVPYFKGDESFFRNANDTNICGNSGEHSRAHDNESLVQNILKRNFLFLNNILTAFPRSHRYLEVFRNVLGAMVTADLFIMSKGEIHCSLGFVLLMQKSFYAFQYSENLMLQSIRTNKTAGIPYFSVHCTSAPDKAISNSALKRRIGPLGSIIHRNNIQMSIQHNGSLAGI